MGWWGVGVNGEAESQQRILAMTAKDVATPPFIPSPHKTLKQDAEGKAYSGYDYAKDTAASSYDSALKSAFDNWQVGYIPEGV